MTATTASAETVVTAKITWKPEARAAGSREVIGHASVFSSPTLIAGSFREQVAPGAFRKVLASRAEVPLVWAHDQGSPLASTRNGSLTLREDARGLEVRAKIVGTSTGEDVLTLIREGLIESMSFAFSVAEGGDEWRHGADGMPERIIREVGALHDVSIVTTPAYADAEVALRAARTLAERVADVAGARPRIELIRPREVYGPGSRFSYFGDLVAVGTADQRHGAAALAVPWAERVGGDGGAIPSHSQGGVAEARTRLASVQERASTTTTTTSIGEMAGPTGVPSFIADLYSVSARPRMALALAVTNQPLPDGHGPTIRIARIVTAAGLGPQSAENAALASIDPTSGEQDAPVGTYAAQLQVSQQLLDFAPRGGEVDQVIAAEFGRAMGGTIEAAVWNGSGSSGQMKGLFGWGGTNQVNASAGSFAAVYSALWSARSTHHTAYGALPSFVAMHPRRWSALGAGTTVPVDFDDDDHEFALVLSAACPITMGSGGTNDVAVYADASEVILFSSPPSFRVVSDDSGSSALTARIVTSQFAALAVRNPVGVTSLQGTLSTPSF